MVRRPSRSRGEIGDQTGDVSTFGYEYTLSSPGKVWKKNNCLLGKEKSKRRKTSADWLIRV